MADESTQEVTTGSPQVGGNGAAAAARDVSAEQIAPKTYDESYVKGLRSEATGYRTRIKDFEAAEAERKEVENAAKIAIPSEVDQLKAQLAASERRAKTLEIKGIRASAAATHGLAEDLHEFITAEDEAGALAQAEKLATRLIGAGQALGGGQAPVGAKNLSPLPPAGGRNPANGGEQAARLDEKERFDAMRQKVPALNNRVLRN